MTTGYCKETAMHVTEGQPCGLFDGTCNPDCMHWREAFEAVMLDAPAVVLSGIEADGLAARIEALPKLLSILRAQPPAVEAIKAAILLLSDNPVAQDGLMDALYEMGVKSGRVGGLETALVND